MMTPTKTLIAEAVQRFPVVETAAWRAVANGQTGVEFDRIEARPATITTTDCLFDGDAVIVLKDARALTVRVFGRFDSRRAEVDQIVIAA